MLKDTHPDYYLDLVCGLESLSLAESLKDMVSHPSLPNLARLTDLTRLELTDWAAGEDDSVIALRGLGLQELVLLDCTDLELELFEPHALQKLEKMHIEDSKRTNESDLDRQYVQDYERELEDSATAVFRLPSLHQLSGMCALFETSMSQGLKSWKESDCPEGTMVTDKSYHRCCVESLKLWIKPGSS